jgi:signal transduction histidine kinase
MDVLRVNRVLAKILVFVLLRYIGTRAAMKSRIRRPAADDFRRQAMGHYFEDGVMAIRLPFVVYDAEERVAAYNPAFAALHREADGTPVLHPGMSFQELMEWRLRTGFFASDPKGSATAEFRLVKGDVVYQLRDGRWMFVDNCPLPDGRLACTWSDITAVKEAERRLRRSQDHLLRAQRIAHVGSIERDLRTDELRWTAEMYEIFGRDPDLPPPSRKDILHFFHPDDRARYEAVMRTSEEGRATAPSEFRVVRPDGTTRWIYHESDVFSDEAGNPALRVATYRDITEIRALQAELLAKERSSAIGEVAATVTHELRNPLSTIKNTLHIFRAAAIAGYAPTERQVDRIERCIDRCNRITSDLLEFSRLGPARCRNTEIDSWLGDCVRELPVPADIRVSFEPGARGAHVALDPGRFRRALTSLAANAVQALADNADRADPARITIRTRIDGARLECTVEDNGPGMTADTLARVFDPLFSTRLYGTGLGLPIVRQIVEQHGAEIMLSSIPGQGTSAHIRFPVVEKSVSAEARPEAA